jgi:hypothetical protein
VHASEPVDALYFPAKQAVHGHPPLTGGEYPVLQRQFAEEVCAKSACAEFGGQL